MRERITGLHASDVRLRSAGRWALVGLLASMMLAVTAACGSEAPTPTPSMAPGDGAAMVEPTATPAPADGAMAEPTPTQQPGEAMPEPQPTQAPSGTTPQPTPTPRPSTQQPTTDSGFDAEAYFDGETIKVVVGFSPGGGYDTFARLLSRYLTDHLPGENRIVVQNLVGGGSLRALRLTMASEPNGFTVHTMNPRFMAQELGGEDVPGFDIDDIAWIGTPSASRNTQGIYVRRDIATSWDEILALGRPLASGEVAAGGSTDLGPHFIQALGGPIRQVYGYGGSSEVLSAFDRGEIEISGYGGYTNVRNLYPEWIEQKYVWPVAWWGEQPQNDPSYMEYLSLLGADIPPHVFDLVPHATEGQREVFNLTYSINSQFSRAYVMPAATPQEIVDVWGEAFAATCADPRFIQAAALLGREVGYGSPDVMRSALASGKAALQDPELRDFFGELAGSSGGAG